MKKVILTSMLLSNFLGTFAQRVICPTTFQKYKNSGLWAVEVFAGPKDWSGWAAGGGLVYFLSRFKSGGGTKYHFPNKFIRLDGFYSRDNFREVRHQAYGVDLLLGYTPFNLNDVFYGSFIVGGTYSNDKLSSNSAPLNHSQELAVYKPGALFGVEVSAFLSKSGNLSVVSSFTQRSLADQYWGTWRWYATLGLRYHFTTMRLMQGVKQNKLGAKQSKPKEKQTGSRP